MVVRSLVATIVMWGKMLTGSVAQETTTFIEIHQCCGPQLMWKVRPQHLQKPVCERGAIDYHPVAITLLWDELLVSAPDIDQSRGESLLVHTSKEGCTILPM